jgi:hypothetical protein
MRSREAFSSIRWKVAPDLDGPLRIMLDGVESPCVELVVEAECGLRRGEFAGREACPKATGRSVGKPKRRWLLRPIAKSGGRAV